MCERVREAGGGRRGCCPFRTAEEKQGRWKDEGGGGGPYTMCVSVCRNVCGALIELILPTD